MTGTVRVIGLGNVSRGDDAAGVLAARLVRELSGGMIDVHESDAGGAALPELMEGADRVILIDAARCGRLPGTVYRLDASAGRIAREDFPCSTHDMGLADAIELARALGTLPKQVIVYGIEAGSMEAGADPADAVRLAVEEVARRILDEQEMSSCTKSI